MAIDIPDWMMEKYRVNSASAQVEKAAEPAPSPKQSLYRQFLNLEMGDTQQEREYLKGPARESAKVKMDPIFIRRMAKRYEMPISDDPSNILMSAAAGPFSAAPTRQAPVAPKVKSTPVFSDPNVMEKVIGEAAESASPVSFNQAFNSARRSGKDKFSYEGDLFNTRRKGESDDDWAESIGVGIDRNKIRGQLRAGALKQSLIPMEPPQAEPVFSDFMKKSGVELAEGKGVDVSKFSDQLGPALEIVGPVLREAGITPEITSGARNKGNWSLHEVGEAVDLRLKNASPEAIRKLEEALPGKPRDTYIHGQKGRMWNDGTFDYIIHGSGNNIHLHIERETEDAKERLVAKLIESGRSENISKKGLSRYPSLLKKYESKMHKVN